MAYKDPSLARVHFIKLSLNEKEAELIEALCNYSGAQPATFVRELVLKEAMEVLHGESQFDTGGYEMQRANKSLVAA